MKKQTLYLAILAVLLVVSSTVALAYVPEENTEFGTKTVKLSDLKLDIVQNSAVLSPIPASTTINVDFANKTAYANGIEYKITEIQEISEISIAGSIPISGSVGGNQANSHGPVYLTQGETVTVAITHTPIYADVLLGFVNSAGTGPGIIDSNHDGAASFSYQVPSSDSYYAIVGAPTDTGFSYSGYITF